MDINGDVERHQHFISNSFGLLLHRIVPSAVILPLWVGLSLLMAVPKPSLAQASRDSHALSAIFDEEHVSDSAFYVRSRTAGVTSEERYQFLSEWVLPSDAHPKFRLGLAFVPTDPSPPVLKQYGIEPSSVSFRDGKLVSARGGSPISPVFDLISVATELGKLDEVRSRIESATMTGELQQRCRLALLILTDIAREDYAPAISHLDELSARLREEAFADYPQRWPETLAVWAGVRAQETRFAAGDLLYGMLHNQVQTGYARGPATWNRGVAALAGRLTHHESRGGDAPPELSLSSPLEFTYWSPLSRTTAFTRGAGFSQSRWIDSAGSIEKIAGHNEDYLIYHSPLRGNYELESDVSLFGWSDCQFSVAGVWVAPEKDQKSVTVGDFRASRSSVELEPEMSLFGEWIHCRVEVRDRICTTYFNGRPVHAEELPEQHDPWIAIRSPWNANSVVRGLRITGTPDIPEQIQLGRLPDLTGWTAYYDESVGDAGHHWRQVGDSLPGGTIVGRRLGSLAGSSQESLLRYQRPMFEDGSIEYEFYYAEGRTHVHPTLDRRAFLLTPEGVRIHWITDGVYDLTGLDPANSVIERDSRRGPDQLPLIRDSWNRLKLSLDGDNVELTLNGQLVYRGELEPTNRRTFGLFHYSDLTEARVRNITWTGAWPRELPPVLEQDWSDAGMDFLDEHLDELKAVYIHDFSTAEFPSRDLIVRGENLAESVSVTPRGLQVKTSASETLRPTYVSPKLIVEGDFDLLAEFEGLSLEVGKKGSSGISLRAILDDPNEQRIVYRGLVLNPPAPRRQLMESIFVRNVKQQPQMTFHDVTSEEATSGRLRIARRGETVYCLFAEGDSPHFRLITKDSFAAERLRLEGVRLVTVTQSDTGSATVVWKRLTIRAEELARR